ncbi:hypothetical protein CC1G_02356 [Coprinopsis cinerea okayama7|uniref:Nephrocystin 3-like N-terminal domain-containing protein n=1 Tax=Coprinopsis cinerea (strain Okayama-7 / 130 / ATCC MYA-4618 / FGSC 9003) TaxID=240176 RepID=A8N7U9_COPC7|nr:hypothetical protein CC1G_02356 [Coprinopsis cinerea okayama7\|eukprot:XP_001830905.2 hypothetical protein CC1G_02356 [Coprinopsis cinerea okayama7\
MGQRSSDLNDAGRHSGQMPVTQDFENEDKQLFEPPRQVNIGGGNFYNVERDLHVQINNYAPSSADERVELVSKLRGLLAPGVNFRKIHADVRKQRTNGTGRWLLESRLYREWKKSANGIIWWMAGAGKTVLASTVIEDLLALESERTCVLMVYSRYTEPLTVSDILKALIKQCVERHQGDSC